MDSAKIRSFVKKGRDEILEIVLGYKDKLKLDNKGVEDLVYQLFMDIIIIKFLEINDFSLECRKFFHHINLYYKESNREDLKALINILELYYIRFKDIFPLREYKVKDSDLEDLLEEMINTQAMEHLARGRLIGDEKWKEVEIVGWMYQAYISDENERIIKGKKKYKKEEIGIATQLFTPKWIVKYMVENSLGRYILEMDKRFKVLSSRWEYYLHSDNMEREISKLKDQETLDLRDIKCFDPALGSGNILVYIMDFLYDFYLLDGYNSKDIPRIIIENNLYGLEIDERVYKIAYFEVMMKAQSYNDTFIQDLLSGKERPLKINFISLEETNELVKNNMLEFLEGNTDFKSQVTEFLSEFKDIKIYGSLAKVSKYTKDFYNKLLKAYEKSPYYKDIKKLVNQSRIMNTIYDVTITNPPYISNKYMEDRLHKLINEDYSYVKYDIFAAFIDYCMEMTSEEGHLGFMTPYVWMFISSYEGLREKIINEKTITSLVQLEYSAFYGATVPICSFTLRNNKLNNLGVYVKLSSFKGGKIQPIKVKEAVRDKNVDYLYEKDIREFNKIPGKPIAYWVEPRLYNIFKEAEPLETYASPRQGLATGNNNKYLRYWYEVDFSEIGFGYSSIDEFHRSKKLYAPYNKGGPFRKWYGNFDYVIEFHKEVFEELKVRGNKLPSKKFYFKEGITWSFVSSSYLGVRYSPKGMVFDVGGSSLFSEDKIIYYILGLLCSNLAHMIMKLLNPTLNFQVGDIKNIPFIYNQSRAKEIEILVKENIEISKLDWDMFETSWDFKTHPILDKGIQNAGDSLDGRFATWVNLINGNFLKMKKNEEELNEIFKDIYNLESMPTEVDDKFITITRLVKEKENKQSLNSYVISEREAMESFLSYFIGCTLGRYSLDDLGIVRSFEKLDRSRYKKYKPINYFNIEGSAYNRLRNFLKVGLGKKNIDGDLIFIGEKLGIDKNKDLKKELERYFINDFIVYHEKMYRRRPIYKIENNNISLRSK